MSHGVDRYLTTRQLADRLGVTTRYLESLRVRGSGPRFVRLGRAVRYSESAVADWLAERERQSTSEAA